MRQPKRYPNAESHFRLSSTIVAHFFTSEKGLLKSPDTDRREALSWRAESLDAFAQAPMPVVIDYAKWDKMIFSGDEEENVGGNKPTRTFTGRGAARC